MLKRSSFTKTGSGETIGKVEKKGWPFFAGGFTPILEAAYHGHEPLLKYLLRRILV
jgi:hypothetical protein